jgi:hypothetical protein
LDSGGGCRRPVDPLLGFLGWGPFRREILLTWGLDFLGFPWILSYESRFINGLKGVFAAKFSRALPCHEKPRALDVAYAEGRDWSLGEFSSASDFPQQIARLQKLSPSRYAPDH